MAKLSLTDIAAGYALITTINANNTLLETALENTLSRDGTTPNTMSADLDMNSQDINNLPDATAQQSPVTLAQLQAASITTTTSTAANVSLADAGGFYTADNVEAALAELAAVTSGNGASIIGVYDTAGNFTATDVEGVLAELFGASTGLTDMVNDTTPQLGGDLDLNSSDITGTGGITITGAVAITGAITGTSFGGITSASLLDKAAAEVVTGQWSVPSIIQGKTTDYTMVLTDAGQTIRFTGSLTSKTFTIPANGSVAYPIGTLIGIENDGSVPISLAVTTDTLTWSKDNTTGTRTLAAGASAVIHKTTATTWKVGGSLLVT